MTTFDFLPREEPGRPLYPLPPDFLDRLMDEFRRVERRRKTKRASTILAIGLCAIGLTYGYFRSYSPAVRYEIPVAKARPRPAPAKREKVPVLEASPGLVHLCKDVLPAAQKDGAAPCIAQRPPQKP